MIGKIYKTELKEMANYNKRMISLYIVLYFRGLVICEDLEERLEFDTAKAVMAFSEDSKPPKGNDGKVIYADLQIDELTN